MAMPQMHFKIFFNYYVTMRYRLAMINKDKLIPELPFEPLG
jgi:hypothetical protein